MKIRPSAPTEAIASSRASAMLSPVTAAAALVVAVVVVPFAVVAVVAVVAAVAVVAVVAVVVPEPVELVGEAASMVKAADAVPLSDKTFMVCEPSERVSR